MPDKVYKLSSNLEIVIPNVDYDDEGRYECSATNIEQSRPVTKVIQLRVECMYYFISHGNVLF